MNRELPPDLFDGTWDSDWWEAKRGKAPLYVIVGVWLVDLVGAFGAGGLAGISAFGILLFAGTWTGAIGQYESGPTPAVIWCALGGAGVSLFVGRRSLRHAIQTTRLFLLLRTYSNAEVDRALKRYKRRSRKKGRRKK